MDEHQETINQTFGNHLTLKEAISPILGDFVHKGARGSRRHASAVHPLSRFAESES